MAEAARHVIETNIPIPPKKTGNSGNGIWQNIAKDMQIGDSVALTSLGQIHGLFLALKQIGKQGTSRQLDAKHWRVWCIKPQKR